MIHVSTTNRYYRVQPAGLEISSHRSEDSAGDRSALHVFELPLDTLKTDAGRGSLYALAEFYGDEVVVIEAGASWDNGDVEGVAIDPATATIVARYPLTDWLVALANASGIEFEDGPETWDADELLDTLSHLDRGTIAAV